VVLDLTEWLVVATLAFGQAGLSSLALTPNKELSPAGIHVSTITIAGPMTSGTAFVPARIADTFCDCT
jgi:hypothetical protein